MKETGPLDQVFEATQIVERPRREVFAFFSDPANLQAITPPWLGFEILQGQGQPIREGSQLEYGLRIHGLPMRWRTLIEEWEPGRRFVDVQLRGPYALWHHTHTFQDVDEGTLVVDRVVYRLPLGRLGRLVAGRYVRRDVEKIFSYRKQRISQLLENNDEGRGMQQ